MSANPTFGGDEVNAVVLDLGGCLCRAGYAGDDTPKAVFPSDVGVVPGSDVNGTGGGGGEGRTVYVGNDALTFPRANMQVANPFGSDDLIDDWDIAAKLWMHALKDRLRVAPEEMAVMMAEPTHIGRAEREKAVTALFEATSCPALFLAKAAVLSAFAVGRQTAVVVDAGHRGTTVTAVHEGFALHKSIARSAAGGALLTRCMRAVLEREAEAKGKKLRPRHAGKGADKSTPSLDAWAVEQVAADAREALCRAADAAGAEEAEGSGAAQVYELPDGTQLKIGADRFRVAEVLFDTSVVSSFPGLDSDPLVSGRHLAAWPTLVKDAIEGCDGDVRRELWGGIVLTGGGSLLPNARERLEAELAAAAPGGTRVRVMSPANPTERRFATWIGGSILASLGSFHQMWFSKNEYEEHGAALIHRKSP
ncbi:hypothetical protein Rsub_03525 [Raphidocelis subcapitata]|uniref:Uncharacterized protein n=1 Tax=Raphidocelis subcapitata TaxID=307507 RepID=A0A2V0NT92_9CHLO|nr:hypothetical protein Rsub_03525 [Raphidocelis subcapitata]|eukprot:GBF90529.1 hypothetical protein Rsub_03525 [Raphidocelis subcapitata]